VQRRLFCLDGCSALLYALQCMNGSPPPPIVPTVPNFKDRRTGLIVFGILEMLLGGLAALMVPLMIVGQLMASRATQEPLPLRQIIPGMAFYLMLAAVLIGLGIGSLKCRRWARALSLIVAWSWLAMGVLTVGLMAFMLPSVLKTAQPPGQGLPESALAVVMVISLLFTSLLMVVVPGVLVVFYQSRHVKATCESRNPSAVWTDACPLPVLGLSLWLWLCAVTMLALPLSTHGVVPAFGTLLSGFVGSLCCWVVAGLWGYCGWAVYRLRAAGWWVVLVSVCVMAISAWITFSRIDLMEMYRQMGYSERQIEMMKQFSFIQNPRMAYFSVAGVVPMVGLLLWVKRYFRSPA
jgi:hypothetical protein